MTLAEQVAKWKEDNELLEDPLCGNVMSKKSCKIMWERANEDGVIYSIRGNYNRAFCLRCKYGPKGEEKNIENQKGDNLEFS